MSDNSENVKMCVGLVGKSCNKAAMELSSWCDTCTDIQQGLSKDIAKIDYKITKDKFKRDEKAKKDQETLHNKLKSNERYSEGTIFAVYDDNEKIIGWESKEEPSERIACKLFMKLYNGEAGNLIRRSDDTICMFCKKTGLWITNSIDIKKAIYDSGLKIWHLNQNDEGVWFRSKKSVDYSGRVDNIKKVYDCLLLEIDNTEFIKNNMQTSKGKLLFDDGIYDFYTNTFTEGFDPEIVFFHKISRKFNKVRDEEKIRWAKNALFDNLYDNKETADYMRASIARAIYGDDEARIAPFCLGETASGKGMLTNALVDSFPGYVSTFDANNLLETKTTKDEPAQNSWLISLKTTRLAFSNEMKMTAKIDSNKFKMVVSDGDKLWVRGHQQMQYEMVNHCTLFFLANDFPEFNQNDNAVDNRIQRVFFNYSFVHNPDPKNPSEKPRDTTIKKRFEEKAYHEAVFWVIADAYQELVKDKPYVFNTGNKKIAEIFKETNATFSSVFYENFEIANSEDKIKASDFNKIFVDKLGFSAPKIGIELTKFCENNKIDAPSKTSNGVRYRYGIKFKAN